MSSGDTDGNTASGDMSPLRISYEPVSEAARPVPDERCFAAIRFADRNAVDPDQSGTIQVGLPQLHGAPVAEVWRTAAPVVWHRAQGFQYGISGSLLFGYRLIEETDNLGLDEISEALYSDLFNLLVETRFPNLLRVWNYFSDINSDQVRPGQDRIERYRAFTKGRFQAIEQQQSFGCELAASTAIGTAQPGMLVYFLAAREPGIQIENPRQVSAFLYPSEYGPRSPSFSRATLARMPGGDQLYISGTASIVGHETRHIEKVADQLVETLHNLDVLAAHAGDEHGLRIRGAHDLSLLKVYIRHAEDMPAVQQGLARQLKAAVPTVFLKGDICRSDLLLEIEGLYLARV